MVVGGDALAALQSTAANGRKVWGCYVLGLDPEVGTKDFKITSFPMKADGTPDLAGIVFEPPQVQWNVPGARAVVKGAGRLEGPWGEVPAGEGTTSGQQQEGGGALGEGGGASGASALRFFKVVVELP